MKNFFAFIGVIATVGFIAVHGESITDSLFHSLFHSTLADWLGLLETLALLLGMLAAVLAALTAIGGAMMWLDRRVKKKSHDLAKQLSK